MPSFKAEACGSCKTSCIYDLRCIDCCARLVLSTKGLAKGHRDGMLEVIERNHDAQRVDGVDAPSARQVWDYIRSKQNG